MIVQHNMAAANTNRQLGITTGQLSKSTEKLSSGYRINRAGDDAAGLSISEKMRGQIRGLDRASTNAQDGVSLIQTAEGALNETHSILQRMRELTVQAASDTNASDDRKAISKELKQLSKEVTRIATETEFNTKKLLSGKFASYTTAADGTVTTKTSIVAAQAALKFQIGANSGQNISLNINDMRASKIGKLTGTDFTNMAKRTGISGTITDVKVSGYTGPAINLQGKSIKDAKDFVSNYGVATAYLSVVDKALSQVSDERSRLGAVQNRLEHTIANADNTSENLQAAESRIRDVDMASEMVKYSKSNILQQAAQSMLAQANQSTQGVLSILG